MKPTLEVCTVCGMPVVEHNADLQFGLPDSVLAILDTVMDNGAWMSGPDPGGSDLLVIPRLGAFVRCLLPVRVEGGVILTYGLWVEVDQSQFDGLRDVWLSKKYADVTLTGTLANKLPFQHASLADVEAAVLDPDKRPVVVTSSDRWTLELLGAVLPHEVLPTV